MTIKCDLKGHILLSKINSKFFDFWFWYNISKKNYACDLRDQIWSKMSLPLWQKNIKKI